MLAADQARCAGFLGEPPRERCSRRFDCARFLSRAGASVPFELSVCKGGDQFIHVGTVGLEPLPSHPYAASSEGVLRGHPSTTSRS